MNREDILHEAYLLTWRGLDDGEMERRLALHAGDAPAGSFSWAVWMAWSLREAAETVSIAVRSGTLDEDDALDALRRRCPGFSMKTYRTAWSRGMCETSW